MSPSTTVMTTTATPAGVAALSGYQVDASEQYHHSPPSWAYSRTMPKSRPGGDETSSPLGGRPSLPSSPQSSPTAPASRTQHQPPSRQPPQHRPQPRPLAEVLNDPSADWSELREAMKAQGTTTNAALSQALQRNAHAAPPLSSGDGRRSSNIKKVSSKDDFEMGLAEAKLSVYDMPAVAPLDDAPEQNGGGATPGGRGRRYNRHASMDMVGSGSNTASTADQQPPRQRRFKRGTMDLLRQTFSPQQADGDVINYGSDNHYGPPPQAQPQVQSHTEPQPQPEPQSHLPVEPPQHEPTGGGRRFKRASMDLLKNVFQPQQQGQRKEQQGQSHRGGGNGNGNGGTERDDGSHRSSMDHGYGNGESNSNSVELDDMSRQSAKLESLAAPEASDRAEVQCRTAGSAAEEAEAAAASTVSRPGAARKSKDMDVSNATATTAGASSRSRGRSISPSRLGGSARQQSSAVRRRSTIDDISVGHNSTSSLLVGFGGDDAERRRSILLPESDDEEEGVIDDGKGSRSTRSSGSSGRQSVTSPRGTESGDGIDSGSRGNAAQRHSSVDDIGVGHLSSSNLLMGCGGGDAERRRSSLLLAWGNGSVEMDDLSIMTGDRSDSVAIGGCNSTANHSGSARNRRGSAVRRVSIDDIHVGRRGSDMSLALDDVMEEMQQQNATNSSDPRSPAAPARRNSQERYHSSAKSSRSSLDMLRSGLREAGAAIHKAVVKDVHPESAQDEYAVPRNHVPFQGSPRETGVASGGGGGGGVFITWDDLKKQGKAPPGFDGGTGRRLTPSQRRAQAEAAAAAATTVATAETPAAWGQTHSSADRPAPEQTPPPQQPPRRRFQRAWQTMDTSRQNVDGPQRGGGREAPVLPTSAPLRAASSVPFPSPSGGGGLGMHFASMHSSGPTTMVNPDDYLPLPMERDKRFRQSSMDTVKKNLRETGAALQRIVRPMGGRASMDLTGGGEWASGGGSGQQQSNVICTNMVRQAIVQGAADKRARNVQEADRMSLVCCPANAHDKNSKLMKEDGDGRDEMWQKTKGGDHGGGNAPMCNVPLKSTLDYAAAFEQGRRAVAEQSQELRGGRRAVLQAAPPPQAATLYGEEEGLSATASADAKPAQFLSNRQAAELQQRGMRKSTFGLDIEADALQAVSESYLAKRE